jgi:hypothetical protein
MSDEHMQVCIDEHKHTSFYNECKSLKGVIRTTKIPLDPSGYSRSGKYYGVGASVFMVGIEPENTRTFCDTPMRAWNKHALRAELKKLYPNMIVRI